MAKSAVGNELETNGTRTRAAWRGWIRGLAAAAIACAVLFGPGASRADDALPAPAQGTLTVDDAVRLALAKNHDLRSVEEAIAIAGGQRDQALQRYLPSLSARSDASRDWDARPSFIGGVIVPDLRDQFVTSYSLRQTLVDWSAIKNIQAANRNKSAAESDYSAARNDLVLAVNQQYYALVRAQLLSIVADSAFVLAQQELRRVQSLFELGMVARGDVLKAEVRVSESQLDRIRSRGDVVLERARLARIIGQDPTDDLRADENVPVVTVQVDSVAVLGDALANRPDLRASYQSWRAAEASVGAARAGYYPTLNAGVSRAFFDTTWSFQGERTSNVGTLSINFPLFQSFWGQKGVVQSSRAQAEQARYAYERRRLDVEVEVREALEAVRQANEGLEVATSGLRSAEEDLKLSQEKYNVGSGTILELIDAQVALQRARSNQVTALTQARVAEAQIARVRGQRF
jgi:outer membrane protein TolC